EAHNESEDDDDDVYEADKILLDTYGDTVTIKRPRDGADDDQDALREKTTTSAGKTTTGSKTHKQSASQSAPVKETMQSTDVFEAPAHQEFETSVHDNNRKKRSILFLTGFNNLNDYLLLIMHGTSLYLLFMNPFNLG
ncbi:hypothetical protein Tco_0342365, partial [Tanacetum coccineum]